MVHQKSRRPDKVSQFYKHHTGATTDAAFRQRACAAFRLKDRTFKLQYHALNLALTLQQTAQHNLAATAPADRAKAGLKTPRFFP